MATTTATLKPVPFDRGRHPLDYTIGFYRDVKGTLDRLYQRNGPVVRIGFEPFASTQLFGPDANQLVYQNKDQVFSSRLGWSWIIDHVFPGSVMAMDGDEHRFQRRIMNLAFKKPNLVRYLDHMNPHIAQGLARWKPHHHFLFYPHIKQLTLDLGTSVFMGADLGKHKRKVNRAFMDAVEGSIAPIRKAIPFTSYWRGMRGRKALVNLFASMLEQKRREDTADFFSQFCHSVTESGERFSDQEIIDHMAFLMMAAHDTTTSTLSTLVYALAKNPQWQEKIRAEARAFHKPMLQFDDLAQATMTELCMKESLRMYPPLPTMPRMTTREVEFEGYRIPANTLVSVSPVHTHYMKEIWTDPDTFDPLRFAPPREEHKRHPFAWVPFGGGAHMCIGQHFAELQVKAIVHQLVLKFRWSVPWDYVVPYQLVPIAKPKDNLPIQLERI
jgi:cytochrome P450